MPRRNRVTPFGSIIAVPDRGTLTGNRGVLHDQQRIVREWRLRRWILCLLEFRGRKRSIMAPGRWTELFFLDEATGLAAGHRPCAECQRGRFELFQDAWARARPGEQPSRRPAVEIDDRLHADRLGPAGEKRTYLESLDELPDGVLVMLEGQRKRALLIQGDWLLVWSPGGYQERLPREKGSVVSVLTPRSTVAAIQAGFVPVVHPSGSSPLG